MINKEKLKISIITVVFNGENTIKSAIDSVLNQNYNNIEYIIIDGGSDDKTMDIIRSYGNKINKIVSEKDEGIYDAMNKGIFMSDGDIIAILNSDDAYYDNEVLSVIARSFNQDNELGCVYGDLNYVSKNDPKKIIRAWRSKKYSPNLFKRGWMPPHPSFFVKKEVYNKYGVFRKDLKIAADYELMLRFIERFKVKTAYIPKVMVSMRIGGASNKSLINIISGNLEILQSWKYNNMSIPYWIFFMKPLSKFYQFFRK